MYLPGYLNHQLPMGQRGTVRGRPAKVGLIDLEPTV
jgi:hypothetical protein